MYIYILTNKINQKKYVGKSAKNPKRRIERHKKEAGSPAIHRAIKKYGFENFDTEIINYKDASEEALNAIEKWQISKNESLTPNGYNLTEGGDGGIPSDETRKKNSESVKRANQNPDLRRRKSEGQKKAWQDPERKKIRSEAIRIGRQTPEAIENHAKKFTPEVKKCMSQTAKENWSTSSHRQKMINAAQKRWQDPEERRKQSERKSGKSTRYSHKVHPNQKTIFD